MKAYVAEVVVDDKTKYIGTSGMLRDLPYFWRSAGMLKNWLVPMPFSWGRFKSGMEAKTTIVVLSNIEKGLKDCDATRLTHYEFLSYSPSAATQGDAPGAAYRLGQVQPDGSTKWAAGGKIWARASDLRSHLFIDKGRLRLYLDGSYTVFEVVYEIDGVIPKTVNRLSTKVFIRRSKIYSKKLDAFLRGSGSLADAALAQHVADKEL